MKSLPHLLLVSIALWLYSFLVLGNPLGDLVSATHCLLSLLYSSFVGLGWPLAHELLGLVMLWVHVKQTESHALPAFIMADRKQLLNQISNNR